MRLAFERPVPVSSAAEPAARAELGLDAALQQAGVVQAAVALGASAAMSWRDDGAERDDDAGLAGRRR